MVGTLYRELNFIASLFPTCSSHCDAGFSDPYVRLGIIQAESRSKQLVKKHNLSDWYREGLVLGKIHHTSVIEKNLNPEWNERKELYANRQYSK